MHAPAAGTLPALARAPTATLCAHRRPALPRAPTVAPRRPVEEEERREEEERGGGGGSPSCPRHSRDRCCPVTGASTPLERTHWRRAGVLRSSSSSLWICLHCVTSPLHRLAMALLV